MRRHVVYVLIVAAALIAAACGGSTAGDSGETAGPEVEPSGATPPTARTSTAVAETAGESGPDPSLVDLGDGWLGVALETVEPGSGAGDEGGRTPVRVTQVFPDTPAAASELREGDRILRFDERELVDVQDLVTRVRASAPGTIVQLTVLRDGEGFVQPVMLGLRPELEDLLASIFLGELAPPLMANRLQDDAAVSLSVGEVVVVDFWATWCGPCRRALPGLNELHARFGPRGVRFIGVSPEEPDVLREFVAETPIDYTVAYDLNHETSHNYFIAAYPTLFVIDRAGRVRHVFVGGSDLPELEASLVALVDGGLAQ